MDKEVDWRKLGWIPREDFPSSVEKDLENLEENAGCQFKNQGLETKEGTHPGLTVYGEDSNSQLIFYKKEDSGRKYLYMGHSALNIPDVLPELQVEFNNRMRFVKHRGDGLKEVGVDIKGLKYEEKLKMEDMLEDMGAEVPESQIPWDEELTKEEGKSLGKQWREYLGGIFSSK